MIDELNYIRVSCSTSSKFEVADINGNIQEITKEVLDKQEKGADIIVFPELCLTGYTCADMFLQQDIYDKCVDAIIDISSIVSKSLVFIGAPLRVSNKLYNCVFVLNDRKIIGVVPKTYLPNYNEFYEARWFTSASELKEDYVNIGAFKVPIGTDLIFECKNAKVAVDICEDLWVQSPPSERYSMAGANIIVNCSASNETISKAKYRRDLVKMQSSKCVCAYVYCSAGEYESTTDVLFSGHRMIYENGRKLAEEIYADDKSVIADIDLDMLVNDRMRQTSFIEDSDSIRRVNYFLHHKGVNLSSSLYREISAYPFVPLNKTDMKERVDEILTIQSHALAHRFKQIGSKHALIGVSGGLDSTLALIVTCKAFDLLGKSRQDIYGITMPCYGTSNRTYNNSIRLMTLLGCTNLECPITEAVDIHLRDIAQGCDADSPLEHRWKTDVTFENAQARERTQILMDYANKIGGLVIGTGDLSELALGWCTYNGDHMSMYGVNTSIPKTLVKYLVEGYANSIRVEKDSLYVCLMDILGTPVSPELLPANEDGSMSQLTEHTVGKFDYNDFFMYHLLRNRFTFVKIYILSMIAFPNEDKEVLKEALIKFVKRFYSQQFKRSCLPDGIKVGSVCLSPRGDWRCPSDLSNKAVDSMLKGLISWKY